jgi:phosphonate transport system substrate-binding protein
MKQRIHQKTTILCILFQALFLAAVTLFSPGALAAENVIQTRKVIPGTAVSLESENGPMVNFGVERFAEEKIMDQAFRPLLNYVGEKLGLRFVINYFSDDNDIRRHLVEGRLQVAHFSSQAYARCLMDGEEHIRYIATVSDSTYIQPDHYRGYIVTRIDHPAGTIADLKGKTFAFVNTSSSSGFSYPLMLLLKHGIDPEKYFSRVLFLGDHPSVTAGVIDGKVDAGATYDGNYNSADRSSGGLLKVIARTPPIPNEPWVAGKDVSRLLIRQMQDILVRINAGSRSADGIPAVSHALKKELEVDSFSLHDSSFYDVVIDMLRLTERYKW